MKFSGNSAEERYFSAKKSNFKSAKDFTNIV